MAYFLPLSSVFVYDIYRFPRAVFLQGKYHRLSLWHSPCVIPLNLRNFKFSPCVFSASSKLISHKQRNTRKLTSSKLNVFNYQLKTQILIFYFSSAAISPISIVSCPVCRAKFNISYFIMKNSALLYQSFFVTLFGGAWRLTVVVRGFKAEQVHAIRLWVGRLDWPSGWYEPSNTLTEEIKRYFSQFTERIDSPVHSVRPPIRLANNGREAKRKSKKKFEILSAFFASRSYGWGLSDVKDGFAKFKYRSLKSFLELSCVSEQPRFSLIKNFLVFFLPPSSVLFPCHFSHGSSA